MTSRIVLYGLFSLVAAAQSPTQSKVIVNDPDDRLSTVPTNWWTYSHQSVQDVTSTISSQNARIVDFTVEQTTPSLSLTVTYVENTGPYYKGWLWYAGADAATIDKALTTNNARLVSLRAFDAGGGQIRFMAAMILNAGKDAEPWWYYTDTSADQITTNLAANNARLIQISSYPSGGKTHYAAVMVGKAANDPGFWWYTGQTPAQITSLLSANNARLVDLDYTSSDGTYNAAMVGCGAAVVRRRGGTQVKPKARCKHWRCKTPGASSIPVTMRDAAVCATPSSWWTTLFRLSTARRQLPAEWDSC